MVFKVFSETDMRHLLCVFIFYADNLHMVYTQSTRSVADHTSDLYHLYAVQRSGVALDFYRASIVAGIHQMKILVCLDVYAQ